MKRTTLALTVSAAMLTGSAFATPITFMPGNLVVSRTVYTGAASSVTVGQTLPGGGTAVADGTYPNVFKNEKPDPSFGITSPIFVDQLTTSGTLVNSVNLTAAAAAQGVNLSTSFPSKSELAINRSTDGTSLTFMSYIAPVNTLDVSNSNTPGHVDSTNPVSLVYQRAVSQISADGTLQVTPVNSYSGNNGRAAILDNANNQYFMVGNGGNGSGIEPAAIVNSTGVQLATLGGSPSTIAVGKQQGVAGSSTGYQFGYSVTENGYVADKSGKDDNFRGETIFNNTLYVTKGSGSNGINSVYQVGATGTLPTADTAASTNISILPGFNTALAKTATSGPNPFGLWFADDHTLYVADEGDGVAADAATSQYAGLEKWTFNGTQWNLDYTLQTGLNLGALYSVGDYFPTATDGLRNITGMVNGDGTVTIFGVTSTVSGSTDQGADPNELVSITDSLSSTSLPTDESFTTLYSAGYGEALRGVALAPVPEPATLAIFGFGLFGIAAGRRKRKL